MEYFGTSFQKSLLKAARAVMQLVFLVFKADGIKFSTALRALSCFSIFKGATLVFSSQVSRQFNKYTNVKAEQGQMK